MAAAPKPSQILLLMTGRRWVRNHAGMGRHRDGRLSLMKTKLIAGVALLLDGLGSALAEDLSVKPAEPAPFYKAPPTVPAGPPPPPDKKKPGPPGGGGWEGAALGCT